MEDLKREKEEKKAYNLASGKNVDIDFEIMIDKHRFKEKILSPHVSSTESKVISVSFSSLYVSEKDLSSKKRKSMVKLTPFPQPTLRLGFLSPNSKSMVSQNMFKIMFLPSTTPLMKKKYTSFYLELKRYLSSGTETASPLTSQQWSRHLLRLRADRFRKNLHHESTSRRPSWGTVQSSKRA